MDEVRVNRIMVARVFYHELNTHGVYKYTKAQIIQPLFITLHKKH